MSLASKNKIKPEHRRLLADYVWEIAEEMRLCNWYLQIGGTYAKKSIGCNACIWIADESHEAIIWFAKSFFGLSPHEQRKIVVHELCHLIMEPVTWSLNINSTPRGKNNQANDNIRPTMERAVDDYATLIAPHVPMPPRGWLTR